MNWIGNVVRWIELNGIISINWLWSIVLVQGLNKLNWNVSMFQWTELVQCFLRLELNWIVQLFNALNWSNVILRLELNWTVQFFNELNWSYVLDLWFWSLIDVWHKMKNFQPALIDWQKGKSLPDCKKIISFGKMSIYNLFFLLLVGCFQPYLRANFHFNAFYVLFVDFFPISWQPCLKMGIINGILEQMN